MTAAEPELPPVSMRPARWSLFLDLDGTVCPIVARPEQVHLTAAQGRLLARLADALGGALCVLSGRTRADLERIFAGLPLRLIGAHGAEPPDDLAAHAAPDAALAELAQLRAPLAALVARHQGIWLEDKGHALALHYRARPELQQPLDQALREFAAKRSALRMMHGNRVIELLPRAISKGAALRRAMQHPDFSGRVPVAVGDDVTDEDAFAAADELGGFGVLVGDRPHSRARYRLPSVVLVNTWLDVLADEAQ